MTYHDDEILQWQILKSLQGIMTRQVDRKQVSIDGAAFKGDEI